MAPDPRPLVVHAMYRFDVGGLENGVVNLINRLPSDRFRHAILALTEITDFRRRLERDDVRFIALDKPPGQGLWLAPRVRRILRELQPTIVHTRNFGALDMALPAAWAGVPIRIHGEHGWDSNDPDGSNRTHRIVRRLFRPLVHRYVALSRHIAGYLAGPIGIPSTRIEQIYNGVDTTRFAPAAHGRAAMAGSPFTDSRLHLAGTVGRLSAIKDQLLLVRAFARARELSPLARDHLRLVIAGDGPLRADVQALLDQFGLGSQVWLAGSRDDVPEIMRGLDSFVLPSRAEGISNTLLEAMATALPVVATAVGGNVELVDDRVTGVIVPPQDADTMAAAMLDNLANPERAAGRGIEARRAVEQRFSLDSMVGAYGSLYGRLIAQAAARGTPLSRTT